MAALARVASGAEAADADRVRLTVYHSHSKGCCSYKGVGATIGAALRRSFLQHRITMLELGNESLCVRADELRESDREVSVGELSRAGYTLDELVQTSSQQRMNQR